MCCTVYGRATRYLQRLMYTYMGDTYIREDMEPEGIHRMQVKEGGEGEG